MGILEGKVAVVTGASGARGTGWGIAEALAEQGAKVIVGARSLEPLERLAKKIGGTAIRCDVSKEADVAAAAELALKTHGKLDFAVNAAGQSGMGLIDNPDDAELQRSIENNYFANVYFIRHMARAIDRDGSITVFSSLSTTHPMLPLFAYACAKSATDCLVKYAALEYGPRNIRINSILAGPIRSEMTSDLYAQPGYAQALEREIPLGKVGEPRDFAHAVLWLATGAYITGSNIQVCGGSQLARFPYEDELPGGKLNATITPHERNEQSP